MLIAFRTPVEPAHDMQLLLRLTKLPLHVHAGRLVISIHDGPNSAILFNSTSISFRRSCQRFWAISLMKRKLIFSSNRYASLTAWWALSAANFTQRRSRASSSTRSMVARASLRRAAAQTRKLMGLIMADSATF
jgi:hypothetical protein